MKRISGLTLVVFLLNTGATRTQQTPQVFSGRISDSVCGASHQGTAAGAADRQCLFKCFKALAKWVLVDQNDHVLAIANQDLPGLPLYAGRPVRLTGQLRGGAILAASVEAYAPHLHVMHVMTNWRDTPGGVGFLIAAMSDGKVAAAHAALAAKNPDNRDEVTLHAGHVLHALDPTAEPKGPGSGYGVKKAAAGALQHLDMAAKADGASPNVKTHALDVAAALGDVLKGTDAAVALARQIRSSTTADEPARLVNDLNALTGQINAGLTQAHTQMTLILKGEGIESAPR